MLPTLRTGTKIPNLASEAQEALSYVRAALHLLVGPPAVSSYDVSTLNHCTQHPVSQLPRNSLPLSNSFQF